MNNVVPPFVTRLKVTRSEYLGGNEDSRFNLASFSMDLHKLFQCITQKGIKEASKW